MNISLFINNRIRYIIAGPIYKPFPYLEIMNVSLWNLQVYLPIIELDI